MSQRQQIIAAIVPTRVGVNRDDEEPVAHDVNCPHTRGGEPDASLLSSRRLAIVPTRVGVNRGPSPPTHGWYSLSPHVGVQSHVVNGTG